MALSVLGWLRQARTALECSPWTRATTRWASSSTGSLECMLRSRICSSSISQTPSLRSSAKLREAAGLCQKCFVGIFHDEHLQVWPGYPRRGYDQGRQSGAGQDPLFHQKARNWKSQNRAARPSGSYITDLIMQTKTFTRPGGERYELGGCWAEEGRSSSGWKWGLLAEYAGFNLIFTIFYCHKCCPVFKSMSNL